MGFLGFLRRPQRVVIVAPPDAEVDGAKESKQVRKPSTSSSAPNTSTSNPNNTSTNTNTPSKSPVSSPNPQNRPSRHTPPQKGTVVARLVGTTKPEDDVQLQIPTERTFWGSGSAASTRSATPSRTPWSSVVGVRRGSATPRAKSSASFQKPSSPSPMSMQPDSSDFLFTPHPAVQPLRSRSEAPTPPHSVHVDIFAAQASIKRRSLATLGEGRTKSLQSLGHTPARRVLPVSAAENQDPPLFNPAYLENSASNPLANIRVARVSAAEDAVPPSPRTLMPPDLPTSPVATYGDQMVARPDSPSSRLVKRLSVKRSLGRNPPPITARASSPSIPKTPNASDSSSSPHQRSPPHMNRPVSRTSRLSYMEMSMASACSTDERNEDGQNGGDGDDSDDDDAAAPPPFIRRASSQSTIPFPNLDLGTTNVEPIRPVSRARPHCVIPARRSSLRSTSVTSSTAPGGRSRLEAEFSLATDLSNTTLTSSHSSVRTTSTGGFTTSQSTVNDHPPLSPITPPRTLSLPKRDDTNNFYSTQSDYSSSESIDSFAEKAPKSIFVTPESLIFHESDDYQLPGLMSFGNETTIPTGLPSLDSASSTVLSLSSHSSQFTVPVGRPSGRGTSILEDIREDEQTFMANSTPLQRTSSHYRRRGASSLSTDSIVNLKNDRLLIQQALQVLQQALDQKLSDDGPKDIAEIDNNKSTYLPDPPTRNPSRPTTSHHPTNTLSNDNDDVFNDF